MELNQNLSLITPEKTMAVNPVPFTGFTPVSDSCFTKFKCRFEENISEASSDTKWWKINEKKTLFYITKNGFDANQFLLYRNG